MASKKGGGGEGGGGRGGEGHKISLKNEQKWLVTSSIISLYEFGVEWKIYCVNRDTSLLVSQSLKIAKS